MQPLLIVGLAWAALVLVAVPAGAQGPPGPRWEIRGFDYAPDGAWRVRARAVARGRAAARSKSLMAVRGRAILPAGPYGPGGAWAGTYAIPVLGGYPSGTPVPGFMSAAAIQDRLFGTPPGPLSLTDYYAQQSRGLMHVTGTTSAWFPLPRDTTYYTGINGCGGGVACTDNSAHLGDFVVDLLAAGDPSINFGEFDNDGPDGIANSADDDGYVDLVGLLHPQIGGECQGGSSGNPASGYRHLWSHRYSVGGWGGGNFVTNDNSNSSRLPPGSKVRVRDYFLTGAEGGSISGCASGSLMGIGTFAHEFGHGLDLPDLYEVAQFPQTQGIGDWGLMSSGNYLFADSPSFMEGWSRAELGWVTEVVVAANDTVELSPTEVADTVYLVPTGRAGEYFLLENRQALESDVNVRGKGLTVWHVDSALIEARRSFNTVNSGAVHGLALEEADGRRHLWCGINGCNRGDGGDVYPGTTGNRRFGGATNPNNHKNDGSSSGFRIDSITQVSPDGPVRFIIRFGGEMVIRAADAGIPVTVDGTAYLPQYAEILGTGETVDASVPALSTTNAGRTRHAWQSWSDGGARQHLVFGNNGADSTITAQFTRSHLLMASAGGSGTVAPSPVVNLSGEFLTEGASIDLTATPGTGSVFARWTGDTNATSPTLTLLMSRPFTVAAVFAPTPNTVDVAAHLLGPTQPLTADQLVYLDHLGNQNGSLDVGDFLAWVKATGAPVPAEVWAALAAPSGSTR